MANAYQPKGLSPEVRAALTPYRPYVTSRQVEALVTAAAAPTLDDLVCVAFLHWEDALATDFDDDVLAHGPIVQRWPARAASLGAHAGGERLGKQVARRIKAAEREQKKIAKLAARPEESLALSDAEELSFLIVSNDHSSPALLRKAARLALRVVRDKPDITYKPSEARPGEQVEFHGHHFYYRGRALFALWAAGDRAEARPHLEALLDWPIARDVALYPSVMAGALERHAEDALDRDDLDQLRAGLVRWRHAATTWNVSPPSTALTSRIAAFAAARAAPDLPALCDLRP